MLDKKLLVRLVISVFSLLRSLLPQLSGAQQKIKKYGIM